jgi:hypothetical protein
MDTISREDLILMLSFKGWTSDELSLMDNETLDNLYIEYIVLEMIMSKVTDYTLEIYKADKRTKEGRRLVQVVDFAESTKDYIEAVATSKRKLGFIVEVFETYVTKTSLMGGKEFKERYDTPYYCSPSSESYWSM